MTTIERAKKFFNRIDWWSGSNSYRPGPHSYEFTEWEAPRLWCQANVARALIRQEQKRAATSSMKNLDNEYDMGLYDGLNTALQIIDAVYGRDHDSTP